MWSLTLLLVQLALSAPAFAAQGPDCDAELSTLSARQIEKKLNQNLRSLGHVPFKVREQRELLIGGAMPPVMTATGDIIIVRKSREDGLKELRRAVHFPEERSWIFIPKIKTWIYTTVHSAGQNSVLVNGVIRERAIALWGSVDDFHTHPWASLGGNRTENDVELDKGYSKDMLALVYLARPSVADDMILLKSAFEKRFSISRPEYEAYIIHPFGLTYYCRTWTTHTRADGSKSAIYSNGLIWKENDLKKAQQNGDPLAALHQMINDQVKRANELTNAQMLNLGIPRDQWPRLIVRFEPWVD